MILSTYCQKSFLSFVHDSSDLKCCVIREPPPNNVVNIIGSDSILYSLLWRSIVIENSSGLPLIVTEACPFIG